MSTTATAPASTGRVLSSTLWNIVGRVGPSLVTLAVIPHLITTLGLARWGIFTIALTLVGSFGIFDFGLGRALTKTIAERITEGRHAESADMAVSGIIALTFLGTIGGLIVAFFMGTWVDHAMKIPPELRMQTRNAMWVLCATAPLVMINAAMWGVISAFQKFRAANLVNIPINIFYYIGPLLVLTVWNNLIGVMLSLAACRLAMTVGYAIICLRTMPELRHARPHINQIKPLLSLGGWMTVSNVLFPLLVYFDRYIIASVLPVAITSFYTTPFEVVSRFSMLTNAVTSSLFPAFAGSWRANPDNMRRLYLHSAVMVSSLLLIPCLLTATFSTQILSLWLTPDFARHSSTIMRFLCLGVLVSGIDSVSDTMIDAIGRPDVNAKFSLVELILYVAALFGLLHSFGILGAAIAWTTRVVLDTLVRLWLGARLYPHVRQSTTRVAILIAAIFLGFTPIFLTHGLTAQILVLVASTLFIYGTIWTTCLSQEDRTTAHALLTRKLRRA